MVRSAVVLLCLSSLFAKAQSMLNTPIVSTVPGETGHLFLGKEMLVVHPFSNDIGGYSDKLFTFGTYISHVQGHFEHRLSWRMITPSFQDNKSTPLRKVPTGRYADWLELQTGYAYGDGKYGLAINYGVGKLGNNGAKQVQHWWHNLFDVKSNKRLTWNDQIVGYKPSYGCEFRLAYNETILGAIGYQKNILLEEVYLRHNLLSGKHYSLEVLLARPIASELNEQVKYGRYEIAMGAKFFRYYTPSIKYTSAYIQGEEKPQIYYDLFNFQIPL